MVISEIKNPILYVATSTLVPTKINVHRKNIKLTFSSTPQESLYHVFPHNGTFLHHFLR